MKQSALVSDLIGRTEEMIQQVNAFKKLPANVLSERPAPEKWSVLDCLEHLNLYGDFYLVELEKRILTAKKVSGDPEFKSGWFGEKTCNDMLPKNESVRKMNTFKDKNPVHCDLQVTVLDRFLKQQHRMIELLKMAEKVDMSRTKTKLTLPVLKFKLGTTLKFVIYHNQRHIWQANNLLTPQ